MSRLKLKVVPPAILFHLQPIAGRRIWWSKSLFC